MLNEEMLFFLMKKKIPDLQSTTQFDTTDCYTPQYNIHIELKCRRKKYQTILIEKYKYDTLISKKKSRYICSFPDGTIYSFNLKKIDEPIWIEKMLPISTDFHNEQHKLKLVGFIPIEKGKNITKYLEN